MKRQRYTVTPIEDNALEVYNAKLLHPDRPIGTSATHFVPHYIAKKKETLKNTEKNTPKRKKNG
jgi:hypothetical protein